MAKATLHIIYDGDCPFCSSYVALLRLREQYDVHLVDARKEPAVAARYGLDLNEGMVVDLDGQVHHGARAMSLLARLSGTLSPLRSERAGGFWPGWMAPHFLQVRAFSSAKKAS